MLGRFFYSDQAALAASDASGAKSIAENLGKGTLYPIGGAADFSLRRFAELAGGNKAKIVILPHSSSSPAETAEDLSNSFRALGVRETETLMPERKSPLPDCSAVFMSGGDQSRMMRLISSDLALELKKRLKEGLLIGGTSAGAAIMSSPMISGGMSDGLPKSGSLYMTDGLGLLPSYVFDTHVSKRSRQERLMAALALVPGYKGIGLDEDTAVEIKEGRATVRGHGLAHVYSRSESFQSRLASADEGKMEAIENILYSVYPPGASFEL